MISIVVENKKKACFLTEKNGRWYLDNKNLCK